MPTPNDVKKFNKKMASIALGSNAIRENLFGAYLKEINASWPQSNPNNFSVTRTALLSFDICALLNKGYSIDDILDPNKLTQEKHDTAKEVYDKLMEKDVDKEWALQVAQEGCNKILEYIDEKSKEIDFSNASKVLDEKNANVFFLATVGFDMFQETGRQKGNLAIDEKYPGISMKLGGVGCLFDAVNQSAVAVEQIGDGNNIQANDYFAKSVSNLAAGKEVADEVGKLAKSNPNKKLSELVQGRLDFAAKVTGYQMKYNMDIQEDGAIEQINSSLAVKNKLINAFLENKLEVSSVDGEAEIKANGVDFGDANQMKDINKQYMICVESISNSILKTISGKEKEAVGESMELPEEAKKALIKKMSKDSKVADIFNKMGADVVKQNLTKEGKLTTKLADTIYVDYLKKAQQEVAIHNVKQGINIKEKRLDSRELTQGRKIPEDIEMYAKATEKIIANLKKTNATFLISSKQYSDLWKAIKTMPDEIRKQPDSPEGYKNIQKKIEEIDALAQKYTFSHQGIKKKTDRQIERLGIMEDIGRFKTNSDRLLRPKIGDNPEKGFMLK